jgi:hypothetical protein
MKKFKLTMVCTCTDGFYEDKITELKEGVNSGVMTKEFKEEQEGVDQVEFTFEDLEV